MDIQKEREAFELVVANKLQNSLYHSVFFNEVTGRYDCADDAPAAVQFFCCDLNSDWRIWQAAKAQAVPDGFVLVPTKNVKYFSNDGENYEIHDNLVQAKDEAVRAIEYYSDRLADQQLDPRSDGNFQQISYGIVLAGSSYSVDHIVRQQDKDNGKYSYEVGTEIMSLYLIEAQEQSHV